MVSYIETIIHRIVFLYVGGCENRLITILSVRKSKEMQFLGISLVCICKSLFISRLQVPADMVAKCL